MVDRLHLIMALLVLYTCKALVVEDPNDLQEYTQILNYTDSGDYQMTVNFGTPVQRVSGYTFNVDTLVDQLIVSSDLCKKCEDGRGDVTYNESVSTSAKNITAEVETYLLPGKLEIQGIRTKDTVCVLSLLTCQKHVEFLAVTDYTQETIVDTFGLGIAKLGHAPSYINALHRDKLISAKTVFIHYNRDSVLNETEIGQ